MTLINEKICVNCKREFRAEQDFLRQTTRWRLCTLGNLWFNCQCGSTLMLRKGHFAWYTPELALSDQAKTIFNQLSHLRQLPHLPNTVMELQLELQSIDVSPKILASKIKQEPLIGAHVLQVAENLRKLRNPDNAPIRSIEHAIVYIGYKSFSDILMSAALKMMHLPQSGFDEKSFWLESHVCGIVAEYLLQRLSSKLNSDEVFLSASLCNIGKLVTAFCFPALASKISRDIHDPKILGTWRQAEESYNFPDHCILGEIGAAMWGFPEFVLTSASKHHNEVAKTPEPMAIAEITAFANQMTHWVLLQPHRIDKNILESCTTRLNLKDAEVEQMADELLKTIKSLPLETPKNL